MPGCLSVSQKRPHVRATEACRVVPMRFSGKRRYPVQESMFSAVRASGQGRERSEHITGQAALYVILEFALQWSAKAAQVPTLPKGTAQA